MPQITVSRSGEGRLTASGDHCCALGEPIARYGGERDGIYAGWRWDGRTLAIDNRGTSAPACNVTRSIHRVVSRADRSTRLRHSSHVA